MNYQITVVLLVFSFSKQNSCEDLFPGEYRLPDDVLPTFYNIYIKALMFNSAQNQTHCPKFEGLTFIEVKATRPNVDKIKLHQQFIFQVKIFVKRKSSPIAGYRFQDSLHRNVSIDTKTNILTIFLKEPLEVDIPYILRFKYNGRIFCKRRTGFMRSNYTTGNDDDTEFMASTRFKVSYARTAFPCFDEPKFKAYFTLAIHRRKQYQSYSNTEKRESIETDPEWILDLYERSPLMSTYSVGFIITEYREYKLDRENITILYNKNDFERIQFAARVAPDLLQALENYTNIKHYAVGGIKRLRLLANPGFDPESHAGAIDNWGLFNFGERCLLCDPGADCEFYSELIATTIAHEFAHLWFGNFITCEWWSYIWLQEGFAEYFQYLITDKVLPHLDLNSTMLLSTLHKAFELDSAYSKNPLTDLTVATMDETAKMTSLFTYKKGASIVRMFDHMIGQKNFKKAIRKYLLDNQYKGITSAAFCKALKGFSTAGELDLLSILSTWTLQNGYPVITIAFHDEFHFNISQQQHITNPHVIGDPSHQWIIPISYTTDMEQNFDDTLPKVYLDKDREITVSLDYPAKWIIANIQQTGYYRVNYADDIWKEISLALKKDQFSSIGVINRAQIIDDVILFQNTDLIALNVTFSILEYLKDETHYLPWHVAIKFLERLRRILTDDISRKYETFLKQLLAKPYLEIEYRNRFVKNTYLEKVLEKIQYLSCLLNVSNCLENALEHGNNVNDFEMHIHFHCALIHYYPNEYWNDYFKLLDDNNLKFPASRVLSCVNVPEKINQLLDYILNRFESPVLELSAIRHNVYLKSEYFKFIADNFNKLDEMDVADLENIMEMLSNDVSTDEELEVLKTLPRTRFFGAEYIRKAKQTRQWIKKNSQILVEYLNKF